MKKATLNLILTFLALIPMTFFLALSVVGIFGILTNFDPRHSLILLSMLFGILGYVGLCMNLEQNNNIKQEFITFVFLLLGIIGFIMFNSLEGGMRAWKWIVLIDEPDEWLFYVGPILITIILTVMKGKSLVRLHQRKATEHDAQNMPESKES